MTPLMGFAQLTTQWVHTLPGSFYSLAYDSDLDRITLTTLGNNNVHFRTFDADGLELTSQSIQFALNSIDGYRSYGSDSFIWTQEILGCQGRYCDHRVSLSRVDQSGNALWTKLFDAYVGIDIRVTANRISSRGNLLLSFMESSQWGAGAELVEFTPEGEELSRVRLPTYATPQLIEESAQDTFLVFTDAGMDCPSVITVANGVFLTEDCLLDNAADLNFLGIAKDLDDKILVAIGNALQAETTFHLMRADMSGNANTISEETQWTGAVPRGSHFSIAQSSDDDLLLAGLTGAFPSYMTRITRIDPSGNIVWEEVLSVTGDSDGRVERILPLPDGSLLIGGQTDEAAFLARIQVAESTTSESPDLSKGIDIAVYPIPARGAVSIAITTERPTTMQTSVYDVTGKRVHIFKDIHQNTAGKHVLTWDGTTENGQPLPSGVFFIIVKHEGTVSNAPVILVQ